MTPSPDISDKTRIAEISAVLATALGKFIFMDYLDHFRTPFIILATIGWVTYIFYRNRTKPGIAARLPAFAARKSERLRSIVRR